MTHVTDDLELYVLGALGEERVEEVTSHLRVCAECRAAADDLGEVVASLAEAAPLRDPSPDLKQRILASAGDEHTAERHWSIPRLPSLGLDLRALATAVAFTLLVAFGAGQSLRLRAAEEQAARYGSLVESVSHGGRTWYMAGLGEWKGSGGNLIQPATGEPAFVVFHDLRPLAAGEVYALWLISRDGAWARGTSFVAEAGEYQMVTVGQDLAGYEQCAVTVERSTSGRREGPVVMQSRIVPPTP